MLKYDEFQIYDGDDIYVTNNIIITQPSLEQIKCFGEQKYFSAVHTLTSVGADLKWQLWDIFGTDYTQIEDYDLFIKLISQLVSSKKKIYFELTNHPEQYQNELASYTKEELEDLKTNPLELVLKDIDLADFKPCILKKNNQIVLYNENRDITIDRMIYTQIVDIIRKIHGFKRNNQIPANERTKMDLIEDARDEAMLSRNKPYKSVLRPLVSALSVYTGQCGDDRIMKMNICKFFDNIKRVGKIQDAQMLLQGAYSGFASLKDIDKTRLDWTGDI